jgi:hypothetical protein
MKITLHVPPTPKSIGGNLELSYEEISNMCREFRNMKYFYEDNYPVLHSLWDMLWLFHCEDKKKEK